MIIGVPRERKQGESRVALTPDGVLQVKARGAEVVIEKDAGTLSGFKDKNYLASGAEIVDSLEEVWSRANILLMVKEPAPEEEQYFREDIAVFSFIHPAAQGPLVKKLLASGATTLDFDLLTLKDGRLPILEPMSVIAGRLAVQCGANALQLSGEESPDSVSRRGLLFSGAPGVPPANVLVIGVGVAGSNAAELAIGLGAQVTVLDISSQRLASFSRAPFKARTCYSNPAALRRELAYADLVIGAVLVPGALTPKLLTKDMLSLMPEGSVIVDICIDQGGFAETSRATSLQHTTYIEDRVVHYCVPNMPAMVPRTSTRALENASLPWLLKLCENGISECLETSAELRSSLITKDGKLRNEVVAKALDIPYQK